MYLSPFVVASVEGLPLELEIDVDYVPAPTWHSGLVFAVIVATLLTIGPIENVIRRPWSITVAWHII
ncbi:hypothetical protein RW1_115_00020 [Rhodococcus wratislaviensis NBRC 100605]|uniref:Uncharacterized protein n=1 Tax=Rhodococcus wratislaviensis NBRC 100605 TaxID=1219028 RepID=X0Q5A9_RHOWR|nr:hypothetical protein RW1_115_00020 [Rhodococcus wratislaviensis NBRC 100605]